MISKAQQHIYEIFTGAVGFITIETITAAEAETLIKIACQIIVTAATVYTVLKKKRWKFAQ